MTAPDLGRRDARANRERVLDVAVPLLRQDPDATVDELAHAAGVARATVYRHFGSRSELVRTVRAHGAALSGGGRH